MKLRRRTVEFDRNETLFLLAAINSADESEWTDEDRANDPAAQRLYPSAYPGDPDAEAEFRDLTHSSLQTLRAERYTACRAELERGGRIDLSDEATGTRWIQMLNDLRLTIGTRIGVTDDPPDLDPFADANGDGEAAVWQLYHWLSYVQETVVTALMD